MIFLHKTFLHQNVTLSILVLVSNSNITLKSEPENSNAPMFTMPQDFTGIVRPLVIKTKSFITSDDKNSKLTPMYLSFKSYLGS